MRVQLVKVLVAKADKQFVTRVGENPLPKVIL